MLKEKQQKLYEAFYESTHKNEYLDNKTELLVGLAAAMALNCYPCMKYYLNKGKSAGLKKGEIQEVLAKVMAVAAGQKRLQAVEVIEKFKIELDQYE